MQVSQMIDIALERIKSQFTARRKYSQYYAGEHPLTFASDRFRDSFGDRLKAMRDNLCPIIVEAPADRMEIINFASEADGSNTAKDAWDIWKQNQLELISFNLHCDALKTGAGYLTVWPDDSGAARFYVEDPEWCTVVMDRTGQNAAYAVKVWKTEEGKMRLNLFTPKLVYKYQTANKYTAGVKDLKRSLFLPIRSAGEQAEVENPYDRVPMFVFETQSILKDVCPLQDALNKTLCDQLVAMEFAAYRQRWATGLDVPENPITGNKELPFKSGIDRLWFTDDEKAKFGEFGETNLEQLSKVADSYRLETARVTGTPLHFFSFNVSSDISGEALKTLESRFTKRVKRLCLGFGTEWAKAMSFALAINGSPVSDPLTVQWAAVEQQSERESLEVLGLKRDVLDIPVDTLREEFGYTPEDIKKFNDGNEIIFDDDDGQVDDDDTRTDQAG